MADSRHDRIYVPARDTGFPGSLPPTPALNTRDRSGERYDEITFGPSSVCVENAVENVLGGLAGGPEQPTRFGGGPGDDMGTWRSTSEVTSTKGGAQQELGTRIKSRDSHVGRRTSAMSATAGYDSTHRARSENFADVSINDETVTTQAKQLQREISRLQREIKTLSARRLHRVRADIAEMLSSDTSRSGELIGQETSYIVPPRTASNKGEVDVIVRYPPSSVNRSSFDIDVARRRLSYVRQGRRRPFTSSSLPIHVVVRRRRSSSVDVVIVTHRLLTSSS